MEAILHHLDWSVQQAVAAPSCAPLPDPPILLLGYCKRTLLGAVKVVQDYFHSLYYYYYYYYYYY